MAQKALTLRALTLTSRRLAQPLAATNSSLDAAGHGNAGMQLRAFSSKAGEPDSAAGSDPTESDESDSVKTSWVLKALTLGTLSYVGYNAVPLMGDSLVTQSVALCRTRDPFLQRSGAYRIHTIATNDRRRERIVEAGGVKVLLLLLDSADEATVREAAKALASLAHTGAAKEALESLGAEPTIKRVASATTDGDIQKHADALLQFLSEQTKAVEGVEQV